MDYLIYNLTDAHLAPLADQALLSAEERVLAARRGERYVLTRCLLRRELARRLACEPGDIRFRLSEHGKPECESAGKAGTSIHFNISHSGDCFAMAFDTAPIGIDVEHIRPRARLDALAAHIMYPAQLAAFRQRGCPVDEFYACWCAAEALVKQAAGSIWQAAQHPFRYEQGHIYPEQEEPEEPKAKASAPTVRLFTPMPGYQGAVASYTPIGKLAPSNLAN